jgi:hypothetical protein
MEKMQTGNENLINELSEIVKEMEQGKEPFKNERFLKILEERPEIKKLYEIVLAEKLEKHPEVADEIMKEFQAQFQA